MNKIQAAIQCAREQYSRPSEIDIDDNPEIVALDRGVWVAAWVFVRNDAISDAQQMERELQ